MRAIYPKALERAGRVALVAHCVGSAFRNDCPGEVIKPEILEWAIAFIRWTLQQARMVYADCGHCESPEAQRIARFVQRFSGKIVTGRRVTEWWTGGKKPSAIQSRQWLADLVALGYGEVVTGTPDKPDFSVRILGTSGTSAQKSHCDDVPSVPTPGTFLGTQVHPPEPVPEKCTYVPADVPDTGTPETTTGSQSQGNVPDVPDFRDGGSDASGRSGRENGRNLRPPETATASHLRASLDVGRNFNDSNMPTPALPEKCTYVPADVPDAGTPENTTGSQFQGNVPDVPGFITDAPAQIPPDNFYRHDRGKRPPGDLQVGDWVKYQGDNKTLRMQCDRSRRDGVRVTAIEGDMAVIKSPRWVCDYRVPIAALVLERRGNVPPAPPGEV